MNWIKRVWTVAVVVAMAACAKETTQPYEKFEDMALEAWITQNRPELADNLQEFEGSNYYLDLRSAGDLASEPINDTTRWIRFDFSGRDLQGNIIMTRRAHEAQLAGTFTKYTHYAPYYMYCGASYYTLMEGISLATQKEQTLGEHYYAAHKDLLGLDSRSYKMRVGADVTLYMPSRVVGKGLSGDGGYEGQYSLDAGKPLVVELMVTDTVKNPLQREALDVDAFCQANGGLTIYTKTDEDGANEQTTEVADVEMIAIPTTMEDENHPYKSASRWVSACDSVAQLYANYRFDPTNNPQEMQHDLHFNKRVTTKDNKYPRYGEINYGPYQVGIEPYKTEASVGEINRQIAEALKKRFHADEPYVGVEQLVADGADSVKLSGAAKIWYIGRFLDGFIFDTNIDEVKEIIYGEVQSEGDALAYTPEEGGLINAFYYVVPTMRYGQWGALITTSTHAYGAAGTGGSTSSSTSGYSSGYYDYLNYLNYYNYYNSYYGGYGMGGMGYGGYGGYYGGYYDNYYGGGYYDPYYSGYYNNYYGTQDTTTTTVVTTSTEIPSYCPLIFEFYIEPQVKK